MRGLYTWSPRYGGAAIFNTKGKGDLSEIDHCVVGVPASVHTLMEVKAVATLYQTSRESKILEIEDTTRDGLPFRMVLTLRKLGVVTMLDYFVSPEEAEGIMKAFSTSGSHAV